MKILRDEIAIAMLPHYLALLGAPSDAAQSAYKCADAMLAERDKLVPAATPPAPTIAEQLAALIGKAVVIEWYSTALGDWTSFRVLIFDPIDATVKLQGMDDEDGNPHGGDTFWTPISDIKSVRARKE